MPVQLQWEDVPTGMVVTEISATEVGAHSAAGVCSPSGCTGVTLAGGESIGYAVLAQVTATAPARIRNLARVRDAAQCSSEAACSSEDEDEVIRNAIDVDPPVPPPEPEAVPVPVPTVSMGGQLLMSLLLALAAALGLRSARQRSLT